jgi:hypothetical protein
VRLKPMPNRFLITRICLVVLLCCATFQGQEIQPEQKARIDAAVPPKAQAKPKPKQPRRMLVTNLSMRDGKPVRGSSAGTIPVGNYAIQQMGKVTGAYEAVFNDDIEMFRPANIKQFDAICFNNTVGVLFDDPELRASLLGFIESGKGFVGIHDAIATFVQYPKYDQWPEFGRMLGGTENGGHPWNGEVMTMKVEDPRNPINTRSTPRLGERTFRSPTRHFSCRNRCSATTCTCCCGSTRRNPARRAGFWRRAKRTWTFP